tara:strand:- start:778 stop:1311 length:534 start_codon:yes stop_codon:yes gene_type:complete
MPHKEGHTRGGGANQKAKTMKAMAVSMAKVRAAMTQKGRSGKVHNDKSLKLLDQHNKRFGLGEYKKPMSDIQKKNINRNRARTSNNEVTDSNKKVTGPGKNKSVENKTTSKSVVKEPKTLEERGMERKRTMSGFKAVKKRKSQGGSILKSLKKVGTTLNKKKKKKFTVSGRPTALRK